MRFVASIQAQESIYSIVRGGPGNAGQRPGNGDIPTAEDTKGTFLFLSEDTKGTFLFLSEV